MKWNSLNLDKRLYVCPTINPKLLIFILITKAYIFPNILQKKILKWAFNSKVSEFWPINCNKLPLCNDEEETAYYIGILCANFRTKRLSIFVAYG